MTVVSTPIYAIHNLESHFDSPTEFRPERWLKGDHQTFIPFLAGPLQCVGKKLFLSFVTNDSLAYAEMRMLLARLVWEFDLELVDSSKLNYSWGLLQIAPAMYMRVSNRQM